jgi:hypothetical protein
MRYEKDKAIRDKKTELLFTLSDSRGKNIFTSKRSAFEIEGQPRFSFGFPTIVDSAGKKYRMELSLSSTRGERVFIDTSSTSLVSIYTASKQELMKNPLRHLLNKISFIFTDPGFVFAILYMTIVMMLYFLRRAKITDRMTLKMIDETTGK